MTSPSLSAQAAPAIPRRTWLALAVLLLGIFMSLLDTTIVNVALPTIRTSLDASEATISWIISGYALAFGLALIPAGRIGDRFGHKWVFFTGLAIFTAASIACGLAQNDVQLIVSRVVQGLGGGIFFPPVTAFIQLLFAPRVRGKAFAILGAVIGISTALGPLAGGLIIQAFGNDTGWRYIFFVNLPLGIIALIAAVVLLPKGSEGKRLSTDIVGLLLASAALVAILVPLIEGETTGWPAWTYISLVGGVVLLVLFAFWERRVAAKGAEALVPPHLFSHPSFSGGVVLAMVYFAAFTSIFFTISIFWQAGLGHTALESGLVSIPFALGSIVGASQSDRLAVRLGRTVLVIGVAAVALGLIALWLVLLLVPATDLTNWALLAPLAVAGVGSGLFIAPNARFITATVDPAEAGAASGVVGTVQRIGSAIGIAVIGSVFFGSLSIAKPTATQIAEAGKKYGAAGADAVKHAISEIATKNVAEGFGHSASLALMVSAIFAIVAFALVFMLPKHVNLHGGPPAAAPKVAAE
ncbi:MAG: transporter [Microbacteriaceae bacterium]|nr:transporter [Microbacteriaceae bacterium]